MKKMKILCIIFLLSVVVQPLMAMNSADLENKFKDYMNEIRLKVKTVDDPAEKRALLDMTLQKILTALDTVSALESLSDKDRAAIAVIRNNFQNKRDELNGKNGFEKVRDTDLDRFADYMLQDIEQARQIISMSVAAFIIIILLIILIL
jgi:hypothetical protein